MIKIRILIIVLLTGLIKSVHSAPYPIPHCPGTVVGGEWRIPITNVRIPLNAANGSVIGSGTYELQYNCPANILGPGGFRFEFMSAPLGDPDFVETEYPGVVRVADHKATTDFLRSTGLRLINGETGQVITGFRQGWVPWGPPSSTSTRPFSGTLKIRFDLIKLNDLIYNVSGAYVGYRYGNLRSINNYLGPNDPTTNGGAFAWKLVPWVNSKITQMPQSCIVTTPNVPVRLPPTAASKLNTVGITAGDTGFNIGLSCKTGTNVYVTLTDLTDTGNTGNQLTLTPDSTAKGVKLRILKNGQPVGYGPDSAEIGNLNQWLVGPSASTTNIPLSAQYIATDKVSGGTVKGVATFTMSYQ
ncbi:fimbrial protein [Burkholderia ambifaria]|uniref:fimbrial protein n=1 Tax=Burkholderia ambifaria TaxID=152480 RepID=UPI000F815A9E|nr:fimbrial protein [Burkholderia ambifaria]